MCKHVNNLVVDGHLCSELTGDTPSEAKVEYAPAYLNTIYTASLAGKNYSTAIDTSYSL